MRPVTLKGRARRGAALALLLAGCGASTPAGGNPGTTGTATRTPAPAPTPTATAPAVFVLLVQDATSSRARFVRRDGVEIDSVPLPQDLRFFAVGGDRLWYVSATGHLHAVAGNGADVDHGVLEGMPQNSVGWGGLAVSPDGSRWIWSYVIGDGTGSLHSRMEVAGTGRAPRVVADENRSDSEYLEPIAWTDAGIVVADQPGGIGGGPLFFDDRYWWDTRLYDPLSLTARPLTGRTQDCPFNDIAKDGSFTCVSSGGSSTGTGTVVLHRADGSSRRLSIAAQVTVAGDAMIAPDGARIAVGVSSRENSVDTYLIALRTGATTRTGPAGDVPVAWLPDGSLVLENVVDPLTGPANDAAILAPDGRITQLGVGAYLGALDARHSLAAHAPAG